MAGNELMERIDKERSAEISLVSGVGLDMRNLAQAFEIAKAMSISGPCVPSYLRNNPGSCLYHVMRAARWGMDPFAVAEKSYEVENKGEKRIAYESQLVRAIAEACAPLQGRLTHRYEGEGDDRVCIVSGKLRGDIDVREHRSPPLGKRRPGLNQYGSLKGSPLWASKPDVQLLYDTQRDWVRMNCPDVLMGVYTREEMEESGFEVVNSAAAPALPPEESLHHRLSLKAAASAGFNPSAIADTMAEVSGRPANPAPVNANPVSVAPDGEVAAQDERGYPPAAPSRDDAGSPAAPVSAATTNSPDGERAAPAVIHATATQGTAADTSEAAADLPQDSAPANSAASSAQNLEPAPEAGAASADAAPAEPAAFAPPSLPADGKQYLEYVRASLLDPSLDSESALRLWWGSKEAKKLRNGLPNITNEIVDAGRVIIAARIKELNADQG